MDGALDGIKERSCYKAPWIGAAHHVSDRIVFHPGNEVTASGAALRSLDYQAFGIACGKPRAIHVADGGDATV